MNHKTMWLTNFTFDAQFEEKKLSTSFSDGTFLYYFYCISYWVNIVLVPIYSEGFNYYDKKHL